MRGRYRRSVLVAVVVASLAAWAPRADAVAGPLAGPVVPVPPDVWTRPVAIPDGTWVLLWSSPDDRIGDGGEYRDTKADADLIGDVSGWFG